MWCCEGSHRNLSIYAIVSLAYVYNIFKLFLHIEVCRLSHKNLKKLPKVKTQEYHKLHRFYNAINNSSFCKLLSICM